MPAGSDFTIDNLPYGVFDRGDGPRPGVAIGEHIVDLREVSLPAEAAAGFRAPVLNDFMALGRGVWQETRAALIDLLSGDDEVPVVRQDDVTMLLPFQPGDYVDFYSSLEHASNLGRMFRPDSEPLLPNWRHLPVGYHGRASSVVVSGTPVRRPHGQIKPDDGPPVYSATRALDFELEVGFVTGPGNVLGSPIDADDAGDHIFGLVLVNDWSARDIQKWEYVPLGPFLGKSFATTVSPWVVTLEALAPYMVPGPKQEPPVLEYLETAGDWGVDLSLSVSLAVDGVEEEVSRTSYAGMYWTMAQQLAHATVNGTNVRPGDLYASGTVSGSEPGSYGSLIELTWGGRDAVVVGGVERRFLEDGDEVVMRGWCEREGLARIGFGECRGVVVGG